VSMLARATRGLKAIDQVGLSDLAALRYVPLENHQSWTEYATPVERNYIAVYQCVRVLSNTFAQLPLKLYRRRADGQGRDEATDHPLYRVLHLSPNPEMTSFVWRKIAMRHLATWGNHYSEITVDLLGRPQLWPISPERIEVRWNGSRREYVHTSAAGVRTIMRPGSVFHMQGQTTDGLTGSSPIADLRKTLGLAQAAGRFASAVFDNGARPGTVLTHPKTLGEPAQQRLIAQMEDLKGSSRANKTVLLEEGMTVTPIGFPPEDAMFLETQLNQHRLIYGAYGIPPHKVGDLERATFSNIEHQALEYIQDGALPWLVNAEQEFAVQLIDEDDVFAEFVVDGYLRGDSKSRAEALAIRLQNGTLTQDQWRAMENENPLPDGKGSQTWMPVNYAPVQPPALALPAGDITDPTENAAPAAEVAA
jgi:HK97 family phage portal protein